jgi:lipoprotein-anchoring transpeptidase ErfK/SrfK
MSDLQKKTNIKIKSKPSFKYLTNACLSAFCFVLTSQQQTRAVFVSANSTITGNVQSPEIPSLIEEPPVPPLEPPSIYFPPEEIEPKPSISNISLVIRLAQRRVYVYQDNHLKISYPIAVGKAGWETPLGSYNVISMQRNPAWEHPWNGKIIPPGPENPLGKRWIGFWTDGKNFIGFHGTPDEHLVGQAVSHGCIRMRNQDILALYAMVQIGTPVKVEP